MGAGFDGWQNYYFEPEDDNDDNQSDWHDAGQCPLCAAPGTRASIDPESGVRVTYCLNCQTATLWQPEVQP